MTPFAQVAALLFPVVAKTFPSRLFYVTAFCWPIAAGLGADWLERARPGRLLRTLALLATAAAGALLAIAATTHLRGLPAFLARLDVQPTLSDPGTAAGRTTLLAGVWLAAAAALLTLWSSRRPRRWVGPGVVGLTALDLLCFALPLNPTFPRRMLFPDTPSLAALRDLVAAEKEPCRVLAVPTGGILPGQMPAIWGFETPTGYSSWTLGRYADYTRLVPAETGWAVETYFDDCCHPLLDALNVRYVYVAAGRTPTGSGRLHLAELLEWARRGRRASGDLAAIRSTGDEGEPRSLLATGSTRLEIPLGEPPAARLNARLCLAAPPDGRVPARVVVSVRLRSAEGGTPSTLFQSTLDPRRGQEAFAPRPVELDLGAHDAVRGTLILTTGVAARAAGETGQVIWIDPTLELPGPPALELIRDGANRIYRNRKALPRAWLVHQVQEVAPGDLQAVRRALASPGFELSREAVVEGRLTLRPGSPHSADRVRVVDRATDRLELAVSCREPSLLVVSETAYPGWRVTVDQFEGPILTANLFMRGVPIPAGDHEVRFAYRATGFRSGLWVAGVGAAGVAWGLVALTFRRRRRPASPEV